MEKGARTERGGVPERENGGALERRATNQTTPSTMPNRSHGTAYSLSLSLLLSLTFSLSLSLLSSQFTLVAVSTVRNAADVWLSLKSRDLV